MTDTSELEKGIGTKEQPKLTAGSVIVEKVEVAPPKIGSKAKIVNFYCKHPDKMELIKLNNMKVKKVQGNNETISKQGTWYREDEDQNIDKSCNISQLMIFYHKTSLKEFVDSPINTELDAGGFLAIKAY